MELIKLVFLIFGIIIIAKSMGVGIEGWASSPGTMIQLTAASSYYPYWQYGSRYRYPYYRFMRNYYNPTNLWPKPYGVYKYY